MLLVVNGYCIVCGMNYVSCCIIARTRYSHKLYKPLHARSTCIQRVCFIIGHHYVRLSRVCLMSDLSSSITVCLISLVVLS